MGALIPITQQTKDYFSLPFDKVTHETLELYIQKYMESSSDPRKKALEIWDTFVPNNIFNDVPTRLVTQEKLIEYRAIIEHSPSIQGCMFVFNLIGLSPFWRKNSQQNKSN